MNTKKYTQAAKILEDTRKRDREKEIERKRERERNKNRPPLYFAFLPLSLKDKEEILFKNKF